MTELAPENIVVLRRVISHLSGVNTPLFAMLILRLIYHGHSQAKLYLCGSFVFMFLLYINSLIFPSFLIWNSGYFSSAVE